MSALRRSSCGSASSARSSSLPSTSLADVEQSRRQIERSGQPPTLEARTLQVGEEICRLPWGNFPALPLRSARRKGDSGVLGPTRERVLPLSGSTRRHQEAGLSAILMADAGSRRHSARRVLPGCAKDSRRTECTLRHDAASGGSAPNLIAVSGPKRNASLLAGSAFPTELQVILGKF